MEKYENMHLNLQGLEMFLVLIWYLIPKEMVGVN